MRHARPSRREALLAGLGAAASALLPAEAAHADQPPPLWIRNAHTGEQALVPLFVGAVRNQFAYENLDHLLRDHREGVTAPIDRRLYDLLYLLSRVAGGQPRIDVISGYRTPRTNSGLAARSEAVAVRSYHLAARAVDFRIAGLPAAVAARIAWHISFGGVGLYGEAFTHCDTGPVRRWGGEF